MQGILDTIADWCSIAGIAGLIATYRQISLARKEVADAQKRAAWGDMVKFVNVAAEEGIAIVPFKQMPFLPRTGERLTLPETPDGLKCSDYRVLDVRYICFSGDNDDNDDAGLINVRVEVEPINGVINQRQPRRPVPNPRV